MVVTLSEQELIDALQAALGEGQEGRPEGTFTTQQICDILGLEQTAVRTRIHKLYEAGMLELLFVKDRRIDGVRCRKPAYRLKVVA